MNGNDVITQHKQFLKDGGAYAAEHVRDSNLSTIIDAAIAYSYKQGVVDGMGRRDKKLGKIEYSSSDLAKDGNAYSFNAKASETKSKEDE